MTDVGSVVVTGVRSYSTVAVGATCHEHVGRPRISGSMVYHMSLVACHGPTRTYQNRGISACNVASTKHAESRTVPPLRLHAARHAIHHVTIQLYTQYSVCTDRTLLYSKAV